MLAYDAEAVVIAEFIDTFLYFLYYVTVCTIFGPECIYIMFTFQRIYSAYTVVHVSHWEDMASSVIALGN